MGALMTGIVPGWFFTSEQWRGTLAPYVADLVSKPGGVLLVAVTVEPSRRNYPEVSFAVFDAAERAALRRALERCRKQREKSHDVDRGDLAPTESSKRK
jgi:hypothetical protein